MEKSNTKWSSKKVNMMYQLIWFFHFWTFTCCFKQRKNGSQNEAKAQHPKARGFIWNSCGQMHLISCRFSLNKCLKQPVVRHWMLKHSRKCCSISCTVYDVTNQIRYLRKTIMLWVSKCFTQSTASCTCPKILLLHKSKEFAHYMVKLR